MADLAVYQYPDEAIEVTALDLFGMDQQDPDDLSWTTKKVKLSTIVESIEALYPGIFNTIYSANGSLAGDRTVDLDGFKLIFSNGNVYIGTTGYTGGLFKLELSSSNGGIVVTSTGTAFSGNTSAGNVFTGSTTTGRGVILKAPFGEIYDYGNALPSPLDSVLFDFRSQSRGVLLPRLTKAQRDAVPNPEDYLILINTDSKKPQFYHPTRQEFVDFSFNPVQENVMKAVACGNSIAVISQFTNASGMAKGIHLANMLSDSCLDFRLMTATMRTDVYGIYGYSGQTLETINPDLDTQWFTPIKDAGIIPDVAIGYALVENDIASGKTFLQMQRSIDVWIRQVRNHWNGVKILLNTPHPSLSYNTPTLRAAYEDIRQYILSLDNGTDIFVSDLIGYSSVDDPTTKANPQTYPVVGSRSGTTFTVTSTSQMLEINSYFFIGASTFYITAFGTGTGGTGTYTVSASGTDSGTYTHCPYTDNSVHPNAKGAMINARTNRDTLARIASVWKRDLIGRSSNFSLNGTTAAGSPATGTVATSMVTTGLASGTFSFTAEQPGVLCEFTNGTGTPDNGTFNFGSIAITGVNTISPFVTIELISGASNLRSIMLRARITDSVGNTFRTFLQTETPDADQDYQDGDILTIVYPETGPQSGATAGSISSLTNYIKFLTKYTGGTVEFRLLAQGYYKIS